MCKNKTKQEIVCISKQRFSSEELVLSFIDLQDKYGILDYYYCVNCKGYHTFTLKSKKIIFLKRTSKRHKKEKVLKKFKHKSSQKDYKQRHPKS